MRMKQLDALRALAMCLVFLEHYAHSIAQHIPIGPGPMGVGWFFTLSGFLISGILLQSFHDAPNRGGIGVVWFDFYMRRILRLMPAYYLVIFALVMMNIPPIADSWPWHAAYLTNVWIAMGGEENVFWSLAVEEQFYLFWPFVIALVPNRYLIKTIIGMIVFSLLFKLGIYLGGFDTAACNRLLFGNLVLLSIGCILGVVCFRNGRANCFEWYTPTIKKYFTIVAFSGLFLAALSWGIFGKSSLVRYFTNDILCGVFYAWITLTVAIGIKQPILKRVFDNAALQYMGRITYGIYLVHNWMPEIVDKYFGPMPKYEAAPLVLLLTFGVCSLSWYFIESPILSLNRYFRSASLKKQATVKPAEGSPEAREDIPVGAEPRRVPAQ